MFMLLLTAIHYMTPECCLNGCSHLFIPYSFYHSKPFELENMPKVVNFESALGSAGSERSLAFDSLSRLMSLGLAEQWITLPTPYGQLGRAGYHTIIETISATQHKLP